jgi:hypothetical protein
MHSERLPANNTVRVSNKHLLTDEVLRDLRDSVSGDIAWLCQTDLSKAAESALRDASAKLRRLLHDGTLMRLRKAQA